MRIREVKVEVQSKAESGEQGRESHTKSGGTIAENWIGVKISKVCQGAAERCEDDVTIAGLVIPFRRNRRPFKIRRLNSLNNVWYGPQKRNNWTKE